MKKTAQSALILLLVAIAFPGKADDPCPCIPVSYTWTVTSCEAWNCAAAASILSNGDRYVLAMPTSNTDYQWVVLKRVASGTGVVVNDANFRIAEFDSLALASAAFDGMEKDLRTTLIAAPDGKILLVSRRTPERRRAPSH